MTTHDSAKGLCMTPKNDLNAEVCQRNMEEQMMRVHQSYEFRHMGDLHQEWSNPLPTPWNQRSPSSGDEVWYVNRLPESPHTTAALEGMSIEDKFIWWLMDVTLQKIALETHARDLTVDDIRTYICVKSFDIMNESWSAFKAPEVDEQESHNWQNAILQILQERYVHEVERWFYTVRDEEAEYHEDDDDDDDDDDGVYSFVVDDEGRVLDDGAEGRIFPYVRSYLAELLLDGDPEMFALQDGECDLCSDTVEPLYTLPCKHEFGLVCLSAWTKQQCKDGVPNTCPMCRTPF